MAFLEKWGPTLVQPAWLQAWSSDLELLELHAADGQLTAVMVLYRARIHGFPSLSTPPFCPWCGPFIRHTSNKAVQQQALERKVLSTIAHALRERSTPLINVVVGPGFRDVRPLIWDGLNTTPKYTAVLDLGLSVDELWANLDAKRRNRLRKAEHAGLSFNPVSPTALLPLVTAHLKARNALHEHGVLRTLLGNPPSTVHGFSVMRDDAVLSWCILNVGTDRAWYLMGGGSQEARGEAGSWGIWQAILHCKSVGVRVFDFEGSMIPEVEHFFRSFGSQPVAHVRIDRPNFLQRVIRRFRP